MRTWLDRSPNGSNGDGPGPEIEAARLASVCIGISRAADDALESGLELGDPALQAVLQACVSVSRRCAEVCERHSNVLAPASSAAAACRAAEHACVEVLSELAGVPMAGRPTSSEAGMRPRDGGDAVEQSR